MTAVMRKTTRKHHGRRKARRAPVRRKASASGGKTAPGVRRQSSRSVGREPIGGRPSAGARPAAGARISKTDYYLDIAQKVAGRSTCLRRNFGAVIVKNDQIVATGYNGAPRKTVNCIDMGACYRQSLGIKPGERYELCRAIHAEQNAIIHASRFDMMDGTLYVVGLDAPTGKVLGDGECCRMCKRAIINAGLVKVVMRGPGGKPVEYMVEDWIRTNLGELEMRNGKLVPRMVGGY